MPKLTAEQKIAVAQWAADGATLNQIQDRLKQEFSITLTYMDTRLLVMELGVHLHDKPKEKEPEADAAGAQGTDAMPDEFADEGYAGDAESATPRPAGGGKVTLSMDAVTIPGALVSGKATFSDGKSASWYLDQAGRLGMSTVEPGYQPPPADVPVFQRELQVLLQREGF